MGINLHKPKNNHRLKCFKVAKKETNPQDLSFKKSLTCPFYAGLTSNIENNNEEIGSKLKVQYDTFTIETYDFVEEINEGDKIYISNFNEAFIVDTKEYYIFRKGLQFSNYRQMPKATRFTLRGKL